MEEPEPAGDHGRRPGPLLHGQLGKGDAGGAGVPPSPAFPCPPQAQSRRPLLPLLLPSPPGPRPSPPRARVTEGGGAAFPPPPAARGAAGPSPAPTRPPPGPRRALSAPSSRSPRTAGPGSLPAALLSGAAPGLPRVLSEPFSGALGSSVLNPGLSSCSALLNPRSCAGGVAVSAEITSPRIRKEFD